ncbi:MAG: AraC family transcriptional regulator [Eubacterium sp.]|nr:AraC family transcriptional regulator [Eubacterium sp.]
MQKEFLLEKAYLGWHIPTFVVNERNEILYQKWESAIPINQDALDRVRDKWRKKKIPAIWHETMNIIHMGFEDDDGNFYLFGPVSYGNISRAQMRDYQFCHRWKTDVPLCHISPGQAVSCLSIMYVLLTGKQISEKTFLEDMGRQQLDEEEAAWDLMDDYPIFFGYKNECAFVEEFKQGEMRIDKSDFFNRAGDLELIDPLARQNYIKNSEYAVVAAISIMRKAAIEMGVPEETCYRISFQYSKKLTECTSTMEMMQVYAAAANDLGKRIQEVKQKGKIGELQEQCKRYIAGNIRRKFTIKEMADELGYHPGYLSRVFTTQEGISVRKYILRERLRLAANILRNSNEKIGVISDYLCFHSQSYMTEQFAKEYGMTPTEYRKKNKL